VDISESLKKCLDDTGMRKDKLAEKLGVTPQTVSTLVKSKYCTGPMLSKLAGVFGMAESEFIALGE